MMTSVVESHVEPTTPAAAPIDREKTCPLLLRVFCSNARHHRISEYYRGSAPNNELQMLDATLRELMGLVKEVNAEARRPGTTFEFALVRPDAHNGQYEMRELGTTVSGQKGLDDLQTLHALKFTIGDYIDVAVGCPIDTTMECIGLQISLPQDVRGRGGFRGRPADGMRQGGFGGQRGGYGGGPRFDRDAPNANADRW